MLIKYLTFLIFLS